MKQLLERRELEHWGVGEVSECREAVNGEVGHTQRGIYSEKPFSNTKNIPG